MKEKIKLALNKLLDFFMNCMGRLVPIFILLGLFSSVSIILGPSFLNLITEDSDLYTNFKFVSDCIAYFVPVVLAYSASLYFKTDTILSLILGLILLYPDFISAISNSYTVYGIPVASVSYASSVVPIILTVIAQKYVEKFVKKIVPESLQMSAIPFLVIAIMLPLELCALGPVGNYISNLLAQGVVKLYEIAGPVETTIISAIQPYLCAFGFARPIFFVAADLLLKNGVEYTYLPFAMGTSNFIAMGIGLGYFIKTREKKEKQVGMSAFISAAIGGVSEPMLFGILMPHKKAIAPTVISGAIAGLLCGLLRLGYYHMGPCSVFGLISYISSDTANLINGIICMGASFITSFVLMLILYKDEEVK